MTMSLKHTRYILGGPLLLACAWLTGCGGAVGVKLREAVLIETVPPGAQAQVSGRDIGVTPLSVELDKEFPRHWTARTKSDDEGFAFYRRLEMLDLKKDGCEPYTQTVLENDLAHDIKITLKCDPNYQPAPVAAPVTAPASTSAPAGIEARLRTLEELKTKGLISDDEYHAQRQRILNGL